MEGTCLFALTLNETAQKIKTLCTLLTVVCFRRGPRSGTRHPLNTLSWYIRIKKRRAKHYLRF